MYKTLKATVHGGQIKLLEDVELPENATVLITILDDSPEFLTAGEHVLAALADVLAGAVTTVESDSDLQEHLDELFT